MELFPEQHKGENWLVRQIELHQVNNANLQTSFIHIYDESYQAPQSYAVSQFMREAIHHEHPYTYVARTNPFSPLVGRCPAVRGYRAPHLRSHGIFSASA
jgi:hypothetical protein